MTSSSPTPKELRRLKELRAKALIEKQRRAQLKSQTPRLIDWVEESSPGYLTGWVHDEICKALEQFSRDVAAGLSPRLMIFMPPQHGKTTLCSERFPVWHMGQYPHHRVVDSAYALHLPKRSSKRARTLARDSKLMHHFPSFKLDPEKQGVEEWETTMGGYYKAVGVGGGLTGSGAHVLIIDDPVKDREEADSETIRNKAWEWWTDTASTRLAPGGGVLLIMTRWHEDDLAGRLLEQAKNTPTLPQWKVMRFPAIAEENERYRQLGEALHPERYTEKMLSANKANSRTWSALYQQRPSSETGNIFKRSDWRYYKVAPSDFDYQIQTWDMTFKDTDGTDFVAGQVWQRTGGKFYLLYRLKQRMGYKEAKAAVKNTCKLFPMARAVFIEDKANGSAIINDLSDELPGLIPVNPMGGKVARAWAAEPYVSAHNCYLPENDPTIGEFVEEHAHFPRGKHDDEVDAFSQGMAQMALYSEFEPEGVNRELGGDGDDWDDL